MIKLIVGTKGSGKTKAMIDMINDAVKTTKGNVVVVEKGMKLTYDIASAARLIDVDEYKISGGEMLYGQVAEGETLAYTWTDGAHTLEADSRPDSASCRLDGEEIGRNRPGVNIAVVDRETGERVQSISFSTLHDYAAYTA